MKSIFFKTLAIIMGMMMSISLVSCGDDDDNNEPEDLKTVAYYDVKYVTDLNDDWFKFFDVTITYVNGAGEEKTEAIVENTDMSDKIQANVAPNTINFKIHVTRKATIPEVDPNLPYHFTGKAQLFVQAYLKDNTKGEFGGDLGLVNTHGTTIGGKDMEKFLKQYSGTDIFDHSVKLKK